MQPKREVASGSAMKASSWMPFAQLRLTPLCSARKGTTRRLKIQSSTFRILVHEHHRRAPSQPGLGNTHIARVLWLPMQHLAGAPPPFRSMFRNGAAPLYWAEPFAVPQACTYPCLFCYIKRREH